MTATLTKPAALSRDPERHRLTALPGIAGLGLDAIASVAYGPEAIVLVLADAGSVGMGATVPVTIANATPSFRKPRQVRARTAEAGLGLLLGVLLIGLAVVIDRYGARPVEGRTILSLVTEGSLGSGIGYVVVQLSTVVLLALAANTSYDGLPVLAAKLAADDFLPHVFGLRADRMVHRYGVFVLAALAGALLIGTGGNVNILVPLFAIGVFAGFLLCQVGMFRHWRLVRGRAWQWKPAFSAFGAVLTASALVVVTASKFFEGGWLIVLVLPLLVLAFTTVRRAYQKIGTAIEVDAVPEQPRRTGCVVVVPVVSITRLAAESLSAAMSMGDRVVAVHVAFDAMGADSAQPARSGGRTGGRPAYACGRLPPAIPAGVIKLGCATGQ